RLRQPVTSGRMPSRFATRETPRNAQREAAMSRLRRETKTPCARLSSVQGPLAGRLRVRLSWTRHHHNPCRSRTGKKRACFHRNVVSIQHIHLVDNTERQRSIRHPGKDLGGMKLTDYVSCADAQREFSSARLWDLFDGSRERLN